MAGFAVGHALTNYHEGLKRGAVRNTLTRLPCAFRATLFTAVSVLLNKLELTVTLSFIQNAVFYKQECNITNNHLFLCIYSIFPDKSEKYSYCLWFGFQINL